MRILVMGGTVFLGRHIVAEALNRGHEVTLFNRGQSSPDLYSGQVRVLKGDRNHELLALQGQRFDVCIDPSAYVPGQVRKLLELMQDQIAQYIFISSISAYAEFHAGMDESAALAVLPATADDSQVSNETYGALKVLCEQAANQLMPGRVLHVRSGLIVGPFDPTHRFTYWPARVARGGRMLAPVGSGFPLQFIDARDQASWIMDMAEQSGVGAFNVASAPGQFNLGDLLDVSVEVSGQVPEIVWAEESFLLQRKVIPWMGLPLWLPANALGMSKVDVSKALDAGLSFRPLEETVAATLAWYREQPKQVWPAGLDPGFEQQLLSEMTSDAGD